MLSYRWHKDPLPAHLRAGIFWSWTHLVSGRKTWGDASLCGPMAVTHLRDLFTQKKAFQSTLLFYILKWVVVGQLLKSSFLLSWNTLLRQPDHYRPCLGLHKLHFWPNWKLFKSFCSFFASDSHCKHGEKQPAKIHTTAWMLGCL